jgi:hypothetical protein
MSMSTETAGHTKAWRALLPREHGLWGWLLVPLVAALALAPGVSVLAAALATVAGFGAANALGRRIRLTQPAVLVALTGAGGAAVLAVVTAAAPLTMGLVLAISGALGLGARLVARGRIPRQRPLELLALAGLASTAGLIAVGDGAPPDRAAAALLAVFAWLVLGLWWVGALLARVLKHRPPSRALPWAAAAAVVASGVVGIATRYPIVGLLPLSYLGRIVAHRPPAHAREAWRVGVAELAWGVALALAAGLVNG